MNVLLDKSYNFFKSESEEVYLKGHILMNGDCITNAARLAELVDPKKIPSYLKEKPNFSGQFSLVLKTGAEVIIISDIIRTYPVFVSFYKDEIFVTNNINRLPLLHVDEIHSHYFFINSFFLPGPANCYNNVYSCQAGEIVTVKEGKINSEPYFQYLPDHSITEFKEDTFVTAFNAEISNAISKMVQATPNVCNWIIPLSGGHDSRIIVNELYRQGIENIICFSYGTPGNTQSKISKQVAEALGYSWHFVEYTEEKWKALYDSGMIDEYIRYSFQGVSSPHLQDFLAVHELKERGIINNDDVFVPGHTLDFLSGGHYKQDDEQCNNIEDGILTTVKRHRAPQANKKELFKLYAQELDLIKHYPPDSFQEYFNWKERQSKFIVNSCRVYEFFGFDFRLPFWDGDMVEFWLAIPSAQKKGRKLLFDAERKGILVNALINIPYEDEVMLKQKKNLSLKKIVKRIIPESITTNLLRLTRKKIRLAEGLNHIFTKQGNSVRDILAPISDFPTPIQKYLKPYLMRYPYQVEATYLAKWRALRLAIDKEKKLNT